MQDQNNTLTSHNDITLVDLDDLRSAFGGEGETGPSVDDEIPSTVMCPQW